MTTTSRKQNSVLELTVKNHPGVMSHVCGLFARRAYNLEGIVSLPIADGETCRMLLLVNEDERLDQIIKQIHKLIDVLEVRCQSSDNSIFPSLTIILS